MKKDKLVVCLTVTEIVYAIVLIVAFIFKSSLVISYESNISLFDFILVTDAFLEYSFLDSAFKFNVLFAICLLVVLIILKFKKTDRNRKISIIAFIVLLSLSLISNATHFILYDHYARNEIWEFSSTGDEDFQPIPTEYLKYFPHFNIMDEKTDKDVSYEYMDSTTYLGRYVLMDTWCYDLEVSFSYEEMQTKSSWLMEQFVFTKGKPNYVKDNYETVFLEAVQNEEYGCTIYQQEDFYELWFIDENNCVIMKYKNFSSVLGMSEEDILKDARRVYDSLK